MKNSIELILGTMTFGEQIFGEDVREMISYFVSQGYFELDTAYVYNQGQCELLIGQALTEINNPEIKVSTKVSPRITGKLDREAVMTQFNESLDCLRIGKVHTLYLHFPDPVTPLEYALEGCARLYEEGKFTYLGLSNFPAWLVAEAHSICKSRGWIPPEFYQGVYNPLSRHAERELDRALDYYDMSFYAYNPLAGGMLTDKYSAADREIKSGRFVNRPNYQDRYWKDSYFHSIEKIKQVCADHDINIVEASYRWLASHSMLNKKRGDGIIVGASKLKHLQQNMAAMTAGVLPEAVVSAFEQAWTECRSDAPEYFRFYTPKQ